MKEVKQKLNDFLLFKCRRHFLLLGALLLPTTISAQEPPQAEYPQPKDFYDEDSDDNKDKNEKAENDTPLVEKPIQKKSDGSYAYKRQLKKGTPLPNLPKPYRISRDGSFYYKETPEDQDAKSSRIEVNDKDFANKPIPKPKSIGKDGSYYYSETKPEKSAEIEGVESAKAIRGSGVFKYETNPFPSTKILTVRGGAMNFLGEFISINEQGDLSGSNIQMVYNLEDNDFRLNFQMDYEWLLTKRFGELRWKISTGTSYLSGDGRFIARPGVIPEQLRDQYKLFIIPAITMINYKIRISTDQWITPYIEGGGGYIGVMERGNDGDTTKFAGAPALAGGAGILISLDGLGAAMDETYGFNSTWIDLQVRWTQGLNDRKDFTNLSLSGGLAFGF